MVDRDDCNFGNVISLGCTRAIELRAALVARKIRVRERDEAAGDLALQSVIDDLVDPHTRDDMQALILASLPPKSLENARDLAERIMESLHEP